jgi:hypothetical protein
MTHYNVHIYREMRLFFAGIEALTPEEAAQTAAAKLTEEAEYTEDCQGENLSALIDLVGDEEFEHSVIIDFEHERLRRAAAELLAALQYALEFLEANNDGEEDITARIAAVSAAIAKANHSIQPKTRKPIIIEVRGGVVQDVLNVPLGIGYEIRDYDSLEEPVEAGRPA